MSRPIAALAALLTAAVPGALWGQASPGPQVVIPCEGPDMPPQCPRNATRSGTIDDARADLAARQSAEMIQQQSLTIRRRELADQIYRSQQQPLAPSPLPQLNPYLALPDFRAAARVVDGIVTGTGP